MYTSSGCGLRLPLLLASPCIGGFHVFCTECMANAEGFDPVSNQSVACCGVCRLPFRSVTKRICLETDHSDCRPTKDCMYPSLHRTSDETMSGVDAFSWLQPGFDVQWREHIEENAEVLRRRNLFMAHYERSNRARTINTMNHHHHRNGSNQGHHHSQRVGAASVEERARDDTRNTNVNSDVSSSSSSSSSSSPPPPPLRSLSTSSLPLPSSEHQIPQHQRPLSHLVDAVIPTKAAYICRRIRELRAEQEKKNRKSNDYSSRDAATARTGGGSKKLEDRPFRCIIYSDHRQVLNWASSLVVREFGDNAVSEHWGGFKWKEASLRKFWRNEVLAWTCPNCGCENQLPDLRCPRRRLRIMDINTQERSWCFVDEIDHWFLGRRIGTSVSPCARTISLSLLLLLLSLFTPPASFPPSRPSGYGSTVSLHGQRRLVVNYQQCGGRCNISNVRRTPVDCYIMLIDRRGSHGLDLSFVTHIFLLDQLGGDEIEAQVIARAYRMGAQGKCIVEQLVMRGTVEELQQKQKENERDKQASASDTNKSREIIISSNSSVTTNNTTSSQISSAISSSTRSRLSSSQRQLSRNANLLLSLRLLRREGNMPFAKSSSSSPPPPPPAAAAASSSKRATSGSDASSTIQYPKSKRVRFT